MAPAAAVVVFLYIVLLQLNFPVSFMCSLKCPEEEGGKVGKRRKKKETKKHKPYFDPLAKPKRKEAGVVDRWSNLCFLCKCKKKAEEKEKKMPPAPLCPSVQFCPVQRIA